MRAVEGCQAGEASEGRLLVLFSGSPLAPQLVVLSHISRDELAKKYLVNVIQRHYLSVGWLVGGVRVSLKVQSARVKVCSRVRAAVVRVELRSDLAYQLVQPV